MDISPSVWILLLTALYLCIIHVNALSCYSCSSTSNPGQCSSPDTTSPSNTLTIRPDCDGSCVTTFLTGDVQSYERQCTMVWRDTSCVSLSATSTACFCNTDFCNGNSSGANSHNKLIVGVVCLMTYLCIVLLSA